MRRLAPVIGTVFGLLWLSPLTLSGAVSIGQGPAEWLEPSTPQQQAAIAARPEYQQFLQSAPGRWTANFDPVLLTPRSIHGSGFALIPADANQNQVETAVLKFLGDNAALFGAERGDFFIDGAVFSRDLWIVTAAQRHKGVSVQGSHLSLSIKNGRLILLQGVSHRVSGADANPRLRKEEAVGAAGRGLGLGNRRPGKQMDADEARSVILPRRSPGAVEYRLAWEVTSRREGEGQQIARHVVSYIDALNGDILAAHDGNRHDYSGTAAIEVERRTVGDALVTVPASFLNLNVAGVATQTGPSGAFALSGGAAGPQGISSQLRGAFAKVTQSGVASSTFSGTIHDNIPFSLLWNASNSDPAERMTYRTIVETNRFVAAVFPSLAWLNTPVPAEVNFNDECNAFWDGIGMTLYRGGSLCNATGRIFDIVAHEWGHGLDQNLPGGFVESPVSEFIGDMVSFVQTNDSRIAPAFFVGSSSAPLRDMQSGHLECFSSLVTETHDAGQLLGAVVWDIHEDLEAAGMSADDLRRLMLLPIAAAQTRSEWYLGMLAVDDDDGNLANGTPHGCLIYRQFDLHSCGTERWPGLPAIASAAASPAVLWPPDHKMVAITVTAPESGPCDSAKVCRVVSVESNEPADEKGDGDTSPDWIIEGNSVRLRAERSGTGSGRVYTLRMECADSSGNASTTTATVTVPKNR